MMDGNDTIPRWGTQEARTSAVVRCASGHIAARETFEDVGGCPYCTYTPQARVAALKAKEATEKRMRQAKTSGTGR